MKIAVEGCAHGELEKIYDTIAHLEAENNFKVDLLLCCGDFQASRNHGDLQCMAVPPKFRHLCTFYKYYSGEKIAPMLTIVIGGNHEASNYFQELPYGGWLAPNIYYLGYAGVVKIAGVKIAGISGIFKGRDYQKGRFECVPYSEDTKRSCYHTRVLDVFRLKQIAKPVDIFLSHDWPEGIYKHGNVNALLRRKPFFKEDIDNNRLGSPVCAELLKHLQPTHWFAAHLHVKFPALVKHDNGSETKFLALDKCLPRRQFLQVVEVEHHGDIELKYDEEWCTILRITDHLTSVTSSSSYMPGPGHNQRWDFKPTQEELETVRSRFDGNFKVPLNFEQTAPAHEPNRSHQQPWKGLNPQTTTFCQKLGVEDPLSILLRQTPKRNAWNDSNNSHNYSSFQTSGDSGLFESPLTTPVRRSRLELPASQNSSADYSPSFSSQPSPRTPMALPTPKFGTPTIPDTKLDSSLTESSCAELNSSEAIPVSSTPKREAPTDSEQSKCDETSLIEYSVDATPSDPPKEILSSPGPKKFKRRNVAIYSLTGDEDA